MLEAKIALNNVNEKNEFLNITNSLDCDIDLIRGVICVDAKSELSVMSMVADIGTKIAIHSDDNSYLELFNKWIY